MTTQPNFLLGLDPRSLKRWNQATGERKFFIDKRHFADSYVVAFNADPYKDDPRDAVSYNIEMQLSHGQWKVRHNATMKPAMYDSKWHRIVGSFNEALALVEGQIGETVLGEKTPKEVQTSVQGLAITDWMDVPDAEYCSMRCLVGANPEEIASRVAFIEKTPRVRIAPYTDKDDQKNWYQGPKGSSPEYGKYEPSREWCDQELERIGYIFDGQTEKNADDRPRG